MTLRVLPVLSLLALAFVVVPAPAEASYVHHVSDTLSGASDYAWREVTLGASPNNCVKWQFWANMTASTRSGWAGGFWVETGSGAVVSVFLIHQPSTGRFFVHYQASDILYEGFAPQTSPFAWNGVNFGQIIGAVCGVKKVGYVATGATNSHVRWSFNSAPTTVASASGTEGFLHTREDFFGTWAEYVPVGNLFDAGASASLAVFKKVTTTAGLMAGFITTATDSRLQVDGPSGFVTIHSDCTGLIPKSMAVCSNNEVARVGRGEATIGIAGEYTFRVVRSVAISGVHIYVVGAPFNW